MIPVIGKFNIYNVPITIFHCVSSYPPDEHEMNLKYIKNLIDEMTIKEKENLLTLSFDTLWRDLWGVDIGIQYRSEEVSSRFKFNKIKENLTLENIINESETFW